METEATVSISKSIIANEVDVKPNPLSLKKGEVVLMDCSDGEKIKVEVLSIGVRGFLANVLELSTGQKWSVSIGCLTR